MEIQNSEKSETTTTTKTKIFCCKIVIMEQWSLLSFLKIPAAVQVSFPREHESWVEVDKMNEIHF